MAAEIDRATDPAELLATLQGNIAEIAHDLSNALGAVLNYIAFLAEDLESSDAARVYLPNLENAARRAVDLVEKLTKDD